MKKILSSTLILLFLIVFLFPITANAATVSNGKHGSNITWKLSDTGTLTLSGTGKMTTYYSPDDYPWFEYSSKVKKVVVSDGITNVPEQAFSHYRNLKEVVLGKDVTSIDSFAFHTCTSLSKINFPSKLKSIGVGTFHSTNFSVLYIPDGVQEIKADAFRESNLTEISLPGMETIEVSILSSCESLTKAEIRNGTKTIRYDVFERCYNLKTVILPDTITSIGSRAFSECTSLTSINLPKGIKTLDMDTFSNSGLTSITIPASMEDLVTGFKNCSNLKKIYFKGGYLDTLQPWTFEGVTATVYYPKGDSTWTKARRLDYGGDLTWVAKNYFEITSQPKGKAVGSGDIVSTKVTATGSGLKYQWYIKNPGASKFSKSSIKTSTYSCTMKDSISGRKVYCVITNSDGETLKTKTVTLSMINIKSQPANKRAKLNATVKTKLTASGDGLKYQWYVKDKGGTKFVKSSITTNTYSYKMTTAKSGRQVYCLITDQYGNTMQTRTATLNAAASITKQPTNVSAKNGATAKTSVTAFGSKLTYQWYICNAGKTKFSKSSITSSTYSCKMNSKSDGRRVYCIITDGYGNTVKSQTVTLKMK